MSQEIFKNLCDKGLSSYEIASELKISATSVRRKLKQFGLKTAADRFYSNKVSRICPKCNLEKGLEEFYSKRGIAGAGTYCKSCAVIQTIERQKKFKLDCVEYKGGKCVVCGFNKYMSALEFHHLDPKEKDFNLSKAKLTSFEKNPVAKKELDKCILVCSNCHRGIHSKEILWSSNGTLS